MHDDVTRHERQYGSNLVPMAIRAVPPTVGGFARIALGTRLSMIVVVLS